MSDLISRSDAIEAVHKKCDEFGLLGRYDIQWVIEALPSADADGEDLIIKGAKGIQDGLYNIKDGKLFKYKANGGTVRTYPIVPSADAVHGEWKFVDHEIFAGEYFCSICGKRADVDLYGEWILSNYCPSCGARMQNGFKSVGQAWNTEQRR